MEFPAFMFGSDCKESKTCFKFSKRKTEVSVTPPKCPLTWKIVYAHASQDINTFFAFECKVLLQQRSC